MKKTKYEFVYQSELQTIYFYLSLLAGAMIGSLPLLVLAGVFSPYIDASKLPNGLLPAILVACFVLVALGAIVGIKIGKRFVSTGTLQIYSDYAILHYGRKTLLLKKNEFRIKTGVEITKRAGDSPHKFWVIHTDGRDVFFSEALFQEKVEGGFYDPSFGQAIAELEASGLPTMLR